MKPKNMLMRTADTTHNYYLANVKNIEDSKVKIFWGPHQGYPSSKGQPYIPPAGWPRPGLLRRIPNVCRVIWESSDMDYQIFFAQGAAGDYVFKTWIDTIDVDNISSDPSVFSSHLHEKVPKPLGYGIDFNLFLNGSSADPPLVLTGKATNVYYLTKSEPFSLDEYQQPGSAVAQAVLDAWHLLGPGGHPADQFVPGAPPFTIRADGPNGNGLTIIKTGLYTVDGMEYIDPPNAHNWPPYPITIEPGYKSPKQVDIIHQDGILLNQLVAIKEHFKDRSTFPYYSHHNIYEPISGINSAPLYHFAVPPGTTDWVGTRTFNVMIVRKPHKQEVTDPELKRAIRNQYKHFAQYKTVVYIDDKYMQDCNMPEGIITQQVSLWAGICGPPPFGDFGDVGWEFGGTTLSNQFLLGTSITDDIQKRIERIEFSLTDTDRVESFDPPDLQSYPFLDS